MLTPRSVIDVFEGGGEGRRVSRGGGLSSCSRGRGGDAGGDGIKGFAPTMIVPPRRNRPDLGGAGAGTGATGEGGGETSRAPREEAREAVLAETGGRGEGGTEWDRASSISDGDG